MYPIKLQFSNILIISLVSKNIQCLPIHRPKPCENKKVLEDFPFYQEHRGMPHGFGA